MELTASSRLMFGVFVMTVIMSSIQCDRAVDMETRLTKIEQTLGGLISALNSDTNDHKMVKRQALEQTDEDTVEDALNAISVNGVVSLLRGRDGSPGRDGRDGMPGAAGQDGMPGSSGVAGPPGPPGSSGSNGSPGTSGAAGSSSSSGGSVYTHWGRKSCGGNSTLVYQGFAASAYFDSYGGGTNYQCLPLVPDYEDTEYTSGSVSVLNGVEYQVTGIPSSLTEEAHDQNVPCARCLSSRGALMMIPAKKTCPAGWSAEYRGYLMSSRDSHKHSNTYECVDMSPEYVTGAQANLNGGTMYFVRADCSGEGSVSHCPPYRSNKIVTCVVCSI